MHTALSSCALLLAACLSACPAARSAAAVSPTAAAGAAPGDLTIINARIYTSPDASPIEHGTLVVHAGRIVSVGSGQAAAGAARSTQLDAQGAVVTAGFWDCHVHLFTPALLHARERSSAELSAELETMFTRWGFTTVFDVASVLANTELIRRRIATGEVTGPRILTVGDPFYPQHGTPIYVRKFLADNGIPSAEVASAAQARERARRQLAAGADGVKIFAGAIVGGEVGVLPMPLDIASAVVQEAHRVGKPAFAHPSNAQGVEIALASGVDVLAHTAPMMGPWSAQLVARLRAQHVALVPTLTLFEVEEHKSGATAESIESLDQITTQQLKTFADGGGLVLFGTDIGYIDVYDTTREFRLMRRALDWRQILASLTTNPAQRFLHRGGLIAPGAPADLTIIDGDPASDITAFARVRYTIRDGRILYRHE
jgi:imidazolonepropionase-like amidohydrolase